jgi:hypothetical protein
LGVVEYRKSTAWRTRASKYIDDDVDSTQLSQDCFGNGGASIGGRKIDRDMAHTFRRLRRQRAGSCQYNRPGVTQHLHEAAPTPFVPPVTKVRLLVS